MIRSQKVFRVLWTVFAVLFCTVALAQEQSEAPKLVDDVKWINITGEVVAPNGESLEGVSIRVSGSGCVSDGYCKADGTFTVRTFPNINAFIVVYDPKNRFAAPLYKVRIDTEPPKEEIVIRLEKGIPFEATFLDETTGKPISGLSIELCQRRFFAESSDYPDVLEFTNRKWQTDEDGTVRCRVMPGEYGIGIEQNAFQDDALEKGIYARNITIGERTGDAVEFRIPSPFIGKVLNSSGSPAAFCSVMIVPTEFIKGNDSPTFTNTNAEGIFHVYKSPENTTISIQNFLTGEQYFTWVKQELVSVQKQTFMLLKPSFVKGRLLDAKTNEPLANRLFFYWRTDPANPVAKSYMPESSQTDRKGRFAIRLNPTLRYEMFVVSGRNESYGGGPYEPRVNLTTLEPKSETDLGDLPVDFSKAVVDPQGKFSPRIKCFMEQVKKVRSGEKKSVLKIFATRDAEAAIQYIEKHQNEEPISSFGLCVTKEEELSDEEKTHWNKLAPEIKVLRLAPDAITVAYGELATLPQLRGEVESPWNVPADDPSNNGDWKKAPGMVNPKILNNFLNGYLEKLEEFKKTEAEKKKNKL